MSWLERAEGQLKNHATALHLIEGLAQLVKRALVDPDTDVYKTLQTIERAFGTLIAGFDGKISTSEVERSVRELMERLAANDSAVDRALDEKFDGSGSGGGGSDGQ